MHVRALHIRGTPVTEESSGHLLGHLDDLLIDPDTGHIRGFFVRSVMPGATILFLQSEDIVSWGTQVHVLSEEKLCPPQELLRLSEAMEDPRSVLGQPIRTRPGGERVGRCADVQFDTKTLLVEWLFPRRLLRMGNPIPTTEILEITKNAIWIRHPLTPKRVREEKTEHMQEQALAKGIPDVTAASSSEI